MSTSDEIRTGVVGLGRIGWTFHCRQVAEQEGFCLSAVAEPDEARRQEARQSYNCRTFEHYDRMITEAELDAVVIASPTHLHRPMAVTALERGLHVILEKPMALDRREAEDIVRTARACRRVLTVYQPHRLAAYFQQLLAIIESGKLGEVYHIRRGQFALARRNDWQSLVRFGGGMLNNYGAHALDQLLQLTGRDVSRLFCSLRRVASLGDADDVVKVIYETQKGRIGELDINQALTAAPYHLDCYGTRGSAALSADRSHYLVRWFDPALLPEKPLVEHLAAVDRKYPRDEIAVQEEMVPVDPACAVDLYADFRRAVREGGEPFVQPEETLAVMHLIEQCRQDARDVIATPL